MTKHQTIAAGIAIDLSRRGFLATSSAAGLVFGFAPLCAQAAAGDPARAYDPTVWYAVAPDGIVTVNVGKADMGQHIASTMAQIIAEELGAAWADMRVNLVGNDPKYNDPVLAANITGGSWSTLMNFETMSRAGAAGRLAMIDAGAGLLGVSPAQCVARGSHVIDTKSLKSKTYAEIVKSGKIARSWSADELKTLTLKTPDQYVTIGQDLPQIDIPFKVDGSAKYGIDASVPGMVYGKIVMPPVRYGATVTHVDASDAEKVPGFLKAVILNDKTGTVTGWVVVVAQTYAQARKAAAVLKVTWDKGPNATVSDATILDEARALQARKDTGYWFVKTGDVAAALEQATKVVEAEYTTSINIHAPMEPMNALAEYRDGILHLHSGNQFMTRSTAIAAGATGLDPKNVVIHQYWLGGGFGRRLDSDMLIPAALAAMALGKPVKVIYSREDDMTFDFTRPLTFQKVRAGLNDKGTMTAMEHDVVCAWPTKRWGIPEFLSPSADKKGTLDAFTVNGADYFYTVPNQTVRAILNDVAQAATPSGQLRSVAPGWTFWAVESMVDELAHAVGKDPAEFRLAMLDGAGDNAGGAQRLRNTLLAAMGLAGYGSKKLPKGEALGVACVSSQERKTSSWTACVAHVAVSPEGEVKVRKLTIAADVGTAVNPDGVRAQVMGAAAWGMSLALIEKATLKDGAIQESNFDSYPVMRMADMPDIEIAVIGNGEAATGCGEPAVTVVAPAIGNAIFNAVGARVRALPITAEAVKAAMKA